MRYQHSKNKAQQILEYALLLSMVMWLIYFAQGPVQKVMIRKMRQGSESFEAVSNEMYRQMKNKNPRDKRDNIVSIRSNEVVESVLKVQENMEVFSNRRVKARENFVNERFYPD